MGFPTARFIKHVDPNLICGICGSVLDTPTLTPCGHTFCEACISTWLDTASISSCPECRASMAKSSARPILSLRNFILSLEVTCPNKSRGCHEVIKLDSQSAHQNVCSHATVVCSVCQTHVDKSQLVEHHINCVSALQSSIVAQGERDRGTRSSSPFPSYGYEKDAATATATATAASDQNRSPTPISGTTGTFSRRATTTALQRLETSSSHITYLIQRINSLEKQVARLLDDLQEAHRKNSFLYFENRHLRNRDHERNNNNNNNNYHHQVRFNTTSSELELERGLDQRLDLDLDVNRSSSTSTNDLRLNVPIHYNVTCQQDIAKLSLHIARYLLQKPSSVDRDRVFNAIRKCYQMQFCPPDLDSSKVDHDVHMLLATAYSSNWFTGAQRILLGCWLQCTLQSQE